MVAYSKDTTDCPILYAKLNRYAEAMQKAAPEESKLYDNIREAIHSALSSRETVSELVKALPPNTARSVQEQLANALLDSTAARAVEKVRQVTFVTIDASSFTGDESKVWQVLYFPRLTVRRFLDGIFFSLSPFIPAYTYAEKWVLRDADSKRVFADLGRPWAQKHGLMEDERSLQEVGITAGMTLEVIRP